MKSSKANRAGTSKIKTHLPRRGCKWKISNFFTEIIPVKFKQFLNAQ